MRPGLAFWTATQAILLLALAPCTHAQTLTQTFHLQPGWNAIWLEVDPPDRRPEVVLRGLNFVSVWTWSERLTATDFIQNPSSAGWNRAQWLAHFPAASPEAILGDLHAILPHRGYLVKVAGTNALTWQVTGLPSLRKMEWLPDRFHLRGFAVDSESPPTFGSFFRPSSAHYDHGRGTLESTYRLNPAGDWTRVEKDEPMRRGEAYWVYSRGVSAYQGPFSIETSIGHGMEFGDAAPRGRLTVRNHTSIPQTIRFESSTPQTSPLSLDHGPLAALQFTGFKSHDALVSAGGLAELRVLVDEATGQFSDHTNVYRASDGQGTVYYLPIRITASRKLGAILSGGITGSVNTGLWMGTVLITNVAQAHTTNAILAGSVAAGFPMRLLIHVDTNGQARLLREASLIHGRTPPDVASNTVPFSRLITDRGELMAAVSSGIESGRLTGRRVSTSHFDFGTQGTGYELPLSGIFAISNQLTGKIELSPDLPANPFLHRYHPDHQASEAYPVTRELTITFAVAENRPGSTALPVIGGTYSEVITGIHKLPLMASGSLYLQRISDVGELNAPLPAGL